MSERVFPPFRQRFLGRICQFKFLFYLLMVFQILLLTLTAVSYLTVQLPPETEAIVYLNFLLLGILMIGTVTLIVVCNRYQSQDKLI